MKFKEKSDLFFANAQFVDGLGLDQCEIISSKINDYYSDEFINSMMQECKLGILDESKQASLKKALHMLIFSVKITKEQSPQLKEVRSALKDLQDIKKIIDKCLRAKKTFEELPRFVSQLVPKPSDWDRELFDTASLEAVKDYVVKAIAALKKANIRRGRPSCWLEHFFVENLIMIYAETWKKKAHVSYRFKY